jgi:hypothetical protein
MAFQAGTCPPTHTQAHVPAKIRVLSPAEHFPRERHLAGAIFMGDNKNAIIAGMLVPRSFHLPRLI